LRDARVELVCHGWSLDSPARPVDQRDPDDSSMLLRLSAQHAQAEMCLRAYACASVRLDTTVASRRHRGGQTGMTATIPSTAYRLRRRGHRHV